MVEALNGSATQKSYAATIDFVRLSRQDLRDWTGDQYGIILDHPNYVAAVTVGKTIHVNSEYVVPRIADDDLFGMMVHEATHVVQHYPVGACVWLKEGIADYVRYYVLRPYDPGRYFDWNKADFRDGYAPAAGLLDWLEGRYHGIIVGINNQMQSGKDGVTYIESTAKQSIDTLWRLYLSSRKKFSSNTKPS